IRDRTVTGVQTCALPISGLAGGANVILIPERPFSLDKVCEYVQHRFQTRYAPIVVVAEGARPGDNDLALSDERLDSFGHVRLGEIGRASCRERGSVRGGD